MTPCIVGTGNQDQDGYGLLHIKDRAGRWRTVREHRLAWEQANGPIPEGMWVLHRCDNPRCINPDHLYVGTHQQNVVDRQTRGRQAKGERLGKSTLTPTDIKEIRRLWANGLNQTEIAHRFKVNQTNISAICRRTIWRHVGD
jgi:hypothetical protein